GVVAGSASGGRLAPAAGTAAGAAPAAGPAQAGRQVPVEGPAHVAVTSEPSSSPGSWGGRPGEDPRVGTTLGGRYYVRRLCGEGAGLRHLEGSRSRAKPAWRGPHAARRRDRHARLYGARAGGRAAR